MRRIDDVASASDHRCYGGVSQRDMLGTDHEVLLQEADAHA